MRSLSLEVVADFACQYSCLAISNLFSLTQVMNGLPAFALDDLCAYTAHPGRPIFSGTLWALCCPVHTESRE